MNKLNLIKAAGVQKHAASNESTETGTVSNVQVEQNIKLKRNI